MTTANHTTVNTYMQTMPNGAAKRNDGKHGRGATGKISFVAAISLSDKGHPIAIRSAKCECIYQGRNQLGTTASDSEEKRGELLQIPLNDY